MNKKIKNMIKTLIEKMKAFRRCAVSESFFCRHEWDVKIRYFDKPKIDDKGRLTTKMVVRTCGKCGKTEHFAICSTIYEKRN